MPSVTYTYDDLTETAPMGDDVKTTDEERDKLVALFKDVPDADKPVAMQAVAPVVDVRGDVKDTGGGDAGADTGSKGR